MDKNAAKNNGMPPPAVRSGPVSPTKRLKPSLLLAAEEELPSVSEFTAALPPPPKKTPTKKVVDETKPLRAAPSILSRPKKNPTAHPASPSEPKSASPRVIKEIPVPPSPEKIQGRPEPTIKVRKTSPVSLEAFRVPASSSPKKNGKSKPLPSLPSISDTIQRLELEENMAKALKIMQEKQFITNQDQLDILQLLAPMEKLEERPASLISLCTYAMYATAYLVVERCLQLLEVLCGPAYSPIFECALAMKEVRHLANGSSPSSSSASSSTVSSNESSMDSSDVFLPSANSAFSPISDRTPPPTPVISAHNDIFMLAYGKSKSLTAPLTVQLMPYFTLLEAAAKTSLVYTKMIHDSMDRVLGLICQAMGCTDLWMSRDNFNLPQLFPHAHRPLIVACRTRNVPTLDCMLNPIHYRFYRNCTAEDLDLTPVLTAAAEEGSLEMMRILLNYGSMRKSCLSAVRWVEVLMPLARADSSAIFDLIFDIVGEEPFTYAIPNNMQRMGDFTRLMTEVERRRGTQLARALFERCKPMYRLTQREFTHNMYHSIPWVACYVRYHYYQNDLLQATNDFLLSRGLQDILRETVAHINPLEPADADEDGDKSQHASPPNNKRKTPPVTRASSVHTVPENGTPIKKPRPAVTESLFL